MRLSGILLAALDLLFAPVFPGLARGAWCRSQRRLLKSPGRGVVWVKQETVPWAEWGAQRGYFALDRMDGIPYLSAMAGAVAPA